MSDDTQHADRGDRAMLLGWELRQSTAHRNTRDHIGYYQVFLLLRRIPAGSRPSQARFSQNNGVEERQPLLPIHLCCNPISVAPVPVVPEHQSFLKSVWWRRFITSATSSSLTTNVRLTLDAPCDTRAIFTSSIVEKILDASPVLALRPSPTTHTTP